MILRRKYLLYAYILLSIVCGLLVLYCLINHEYKSAPEIHGNNDQEVSKLLLSSALLIPKEVPSTFCYGYHNLLTDSLILKHELHNFTRYLEVLNHGVKLVQLPAALSLDIVNQCRGLNKPMLFHHQHSLEIRFPRALRDMSKYSRTMSQIQKEKNLFNFDPLSFSNDNTSLKHLSEKVLYYIESFEYHAIYCTNKRDGRDDWTRRDPYWLSVAKAVVNTSAWQLNMGTDFIAPASHPKSSPSRADPFMLNFLKRLSFLRTDFDHSGSGPKDMIVPYFADIEYEKTNNLLYSSLSTPHAPTFYSDAVKSALRVTRILHESAANIAKTKSREGPLLFFGGSNNPPSGLRAKLRDCIYRQSAEAYQILGIKPEKIEIILHHISQSSYFEKLLTSRFCLMVRGDTASSRRLFSALKYRCIPVIISDWIELPFQRFIDYSLFTLRFPESVSNNVLPMLRELSSLPRSKEAAMRRALEHARMILLFDDLDTETAVHNGKNNNKGEGASEEGTDCKRSLLNPVTMTLMEAFVRRRDQCALLFPPSTSSSSVSSEDSTGPWCSSFAADIKKSI